MRILVAVNLVDIFSWDTDESLFTLSGGRGYGEETLVKGVGIVINYSLRRVEFMRSSRHLARDWHGGQRMLCF